MESFWKLRNRLTNCPIVFSCGQNAYGHPSISTIDSFQRNGFDLFSTNKVGGLIGTESDIMKTRKTLLGMYAKGTLAISKKPLKYYGDKSFSISAGVPQLK